MFGNVLKDKAADALGSLDQPHTYIRDFAKGLVILGEQEGALGEVWHVPSAKTVTGRELVEQIFIAAGKEPKFRIASRGLVSFMGLFNPAMRELKEDMYRFEQPYVVDHSKFEKAFGFISTPHEEAIKETLEWYKNR